MDIAESQFGIKQIPEILQVQEIAQVIKDILINVLKDLEVNDKTAKEITELCLEIAQKSQNVLQYENIARKIFERYHFT